MNREQLIARAQAAGVDVLVCGAGMLGAGFIAGLMAGSTAASVVAWTAGIGYGLIEAFTGASVGKVMGGLKVVGLEGDAVERNDMLRRWGIKCGWMLLCVGAAVSGWQWVWWAAFLGAGVAAASFLVGLGEGREAWHDVIAKTRIRATEPKAQMAIQMPQRAPLEQERKAA